MLRNQKIKTTHLSRSAYLYVRQSTLRQVYENSESTKRQYALKQQAISLGWSVEQIITIDSDLGQSGATSLERSGFQKLVADVGMGKAGIVMGLEVSRLSRSSSDWGRLLEICAITDTLIMDEDGIYDTNDFNDRLLLGLKGTMSEAELHFLQARMRGGLLNKARRGELKRPLPIGYVYDDNDRIIFDPDQQVQQALHLFFKMFRSIGTAWGTVQKFNKQGFKFPLRVHKGFKKGELHWTQLVHSRTLQILHNPMYAGVYFYGETQVQRTAHGKKSVSMSRDEWHTYLPGSHPGYISLDDYENNLKLLKENAHPRHEDGRKTPPREGPALLQGIVFCGYCGQRMTIRYQNNGNRLVPIYVCQKKKIEFGGEACQFVYGKGIDEAISEILLEMVNPLAIEAALDVQKELNNRKNEVDNYYQQQLEGARYEVELARRRYMRVDPDNRLVASQLEADWNQKIHEFEEMRENYEKQRKSQPSMLEDAVESDILNIAAQFPEVWNDKHVPERDRKRIVRCLIEDVTIKQGEEIELGIRFRGGTTKTMAISRPRRIWQKWTTRPEVIQKIDQLTDDFIPEEIADLLNNQGIKPSKGQAFKKRIVENIIREHKIKNRYQRLREAGMLTLCEKMKELGVCQDKLRKLLQTGQIKGYRYSSRDSFLYEPQKTKQI